MPIPQTRQELVDQIETAFAKLNAELLDIDVELADRICVDDWSIKDLLAVRLWWTRNVLNWVEKGQQGKVPVTPAKGYRWHETPRLNDAVVRNSQGRSFKSIVSGLRRQYTRLLATIEDLNDHQLLEKGVYKWAGNYPIARWLSINTTRQYQTARTYIRRVKRQLADEQEAIN